MKWLLSCFLTILLLFEGAMSSNAGPVRLIPLQYWKGTPVQPTEADSCSQEVTPKSGQETLSIYFNLFKGERGYGTLGREETLKKQAAECLRPEKLANFKLNDAELQFTFPLSQDARCVMWFVLAMRRSGLRYTLDTKTKTFNISLHVSTKGKGCAAHALPTSGDKFRFCIVKKCDSENGIPFISEQHVIHDSRAITPNTNPILNDFCDLECRYESYQIKEAANGAQIVVKPKKGYTTLVTNPPGTTEDVQRAGTGQSWYQVATVVCVVFLLAAIIISVAILLFMNRKILPMMTRLIEHEEERQVQSNFQELHTGDRILTLNDNPVHGKSGKDKILDAIESEGLVKIEVKRPITEAADLLVMKEMYPEMKRVSPAPLRRDACEIGKRQSAKPVAKAEKSILKQRGSRSSFQVTFVENVKVCNIPTDFMCKGRKKKSPEEEEKTVAA
ncbi:hypothetical protein QR680_018820 [Steinernema hermaphroditum]|uniref:PDZ domain-containing protein n=1 Tax=Steinernema hermaphroditum TaxID=289476 RepID=A0AA39HJ32_9BILA|nr:hypothetical protein QR680_018820 [Steinernema hermaphroditum]